MKLRKNRSERPEKRYSGLPRAQFNTCMLKAFLSLVQPLCLFVVSCLSFLWSAPVHILQRAQVIWPTGLLFRPQRCRCSERPHRLHFLSRQQIQHQAGAAGLRHPGYSHAAEQQRSDTMVLQQTSTRRYGRSPTDKYVILNTGLHSLYLNPAHTVHGCQV